jgi:hypothetical protein
VVLLTNVKLLFLVASANVGEYPFVGDSEEGSFEKSKCVLIELLSIASDFQLKKLNHWELDGPASANNLHVEADGEITSHFLLLKFKVLRFFDILLREPRWSPCRAGCKLDVIRFRQRNKLVG